MPVHQENDPPAAAWWHALALLCAAQFMVVLDVTVSNVALPSIAADLHVARADLQWVITAYVLCAGGLLLLGGRAADLLGRRRMFATGLAMFTAASLASGMAGSVTALIAARTLQGVGAALLTPAALSLLVTTYSGARRTTALTTWGAIGSGGAAAGVLVGGALTTWLGWQSVYLVNVPVGIVALALVGRVLPGAPAVAAPWRRLDLPGGAALVAGLGVLVYGVQGAAVHGWGSARTVVLLVTAAGLLVGFALIERRAAHPIVPPATWRSPTLTGGAGVMLVATGILVGAFFLNSLYLQGVVGASALETGLSFLPIAVAIGAGAHLAGRLLGRFGARIVVAAGLLLVAAAAAVLSGAPADPVYASDLLPAFVTLGLGVGLTFPGASVTAMSAVGHESAGVASGLMSTAHEIGAALGVAVLGTVAASAPGGATAGYHAGFVVAAAAAAALAGAVALRMPAVRPAHGAAVSLH